MAEPSFQVVELRCPLPPGRLFARLRMGGQQPSYVHPDNLIEMACYDCRKRLERQGRQVTRVLHRYDLAGTLITTLVEEPMERARQAVERARALNADAARLQARARVIADRDEG